MSSGTRHPMQAAAMLAFLGLWVSAGRTAAQVIVATVFVSSTENPAEPILNRLHEAAYAVAAPVAADRIEVNGAARVRLGDAVQPIPGATWSSLGMTGFGDGSHLVVSGWLDGPIPGEDFATAIYGGGSPVLLFQWGITQAPGTPAGTTFAGGWVSINGNGQVALHFGLDGPGVDCNAGSPSYNCEGIWAGDPSGGLTLTARAGDPAGSIPGAVYKRFGSDAYRIPVAFNRTGQLTFLARLAGGSIGTANDTAVFRGTAGSVALLAWEGQVAPGGGIYGEISEPSIGSSGAVAFLAGSAVYLNGVRVAQAGDPAPRGGTIQSVSFPAMDDSLVFRAEVLDGGSLLDSYMTLVGGELVEVVREGDSAPETGGQTFSMLTSNAVVNECGQIPFQGRLADGRDGLWIFQRAGAGVLVALEGEPSPHGPDYSSFQGFLGDRAARTNLSDGGSRYFNQAGRLVFRADLTDGSGGVFLSGTPGLPCDHIFTDGFESGDTSAWTALP